MKTTGMFWVRAFVVAASTAVVGLSVVACDASGDSSETQDVKAKFEAPEAGSCDERGMITAANDADLAELDDTAKLSSSAAKNLIAARPFATIAEIDAVAQMGDAALVALLKHARAAGYVSACEDGATSEIGVISDLDDTVIPPANPELSVPPYPGVAALYQTLEHRGGGAAGDLRYVTARLPARVVDVPAYLEKHGVPTGVIETGVSGIPAVAENEKVKDITRIMESSGDQRFVLFGDATHRDPEVYQRVRAAFPDRVAAAIIHREGVDVPAARVEGLYLCDDYAEASAVLFGLGLLTRAEALEVMESAAAQGLAITDAEMKALLDAEE
jgi:hypothetical protein